MGSQIEVKLNFAIFITALRCLGFDLAFHKGQLGGAVVWIGASLTAGLEEVVIGVKQQILDSAPHYRPTPGGRLLDSWIREGGCTRTANVGVLSGASS
eukprot:501021-Amphidinium_carterae.1